MDLTLVIAADPALLALGPQREVAVIIGHIPRFGPNGDSFF